MLKLSKYAIIFGTGALLCTPAFAIPGPSVSYGANPVWAVGGTVQNTSSTIATAPSDQVLIVTDLLLSMTEASCSSTLSIETSGGDTLGVFRLVSRKWSWHGSYGNTGNYTQPSSVEHSFGSGLPIPLSQDLYLTESGNCDVAYTVSGYYAEP
jgi:hypothetical protein